MKPKPHSSIRNIILAASIAFAIPCAQAESMSELLEKGIYTEETKRDLDAAITIYRQLVSDGQTAQSLAAQAQYRLGLCLEKQKRTSDATAAFEKLIRDFAKEKDWVEKARQHLPDAFVLGPVPWLDGERLQLVITTPNGADIGATVSDLLSYRNWDELFAERFLPARAPRGVPRTASREGLLRDRLHQLLRRGEGAE